MWITKTEDLQRAKPLEAEAERLRREIDDMEALTTTAACRLCGAESTLTAEHAPSKKAGNVGRMVRGMIDHAASAAGGSVMWTADIVQGAKEHSLCAPCNNNTGSWYNGAYVRLVRTARKLAKAKAAGTTCAVDVLNPQRVAKQALVSIIATSQPGLTARYPHLRTLLCDREATGPIDPIRVWLYLKADPSATTTGLTAGLDIDRGRGHLVAGFSFWPLGWVMTIGDVDVKGTINVSGWTEMAYMDRGPVRVQIPCQWAISPYPGDFRGPDEFPRESWRIQPR
jgi:hypothetical protein